MTRRRNRIRRSCYDVLSIQPLESRLCLSAVSMIAAAAAADNESFEFEELEELVEEAHENGYQVKLQDHHVPELVDDVIAHVAESLLIAPTELHELVIASSSASPDDGTATLGLSESESTTDVEAGNTTAPATTTVVSGNVAVLTKITDLPDAAAVVPVENSPEVASAAAEVPEESDGISHDGSSVGNSGVANSGVDVQAVVIAEGSVAAESSQGREEALVVDDLSAVNVDGVVVADFSDTAIGIRYGSAFGLLSEQIRLPFSMDGAANDGIDVPARSNVASATSNATVLIAAAMAGGVLAASNAPNSPAVQKIVRKIRRSIRPAI